MSSTTNSYAESTTFVLRTEDTGWIARNGGMVAPDGKVTVQVPANEVEPVPFAGHLFLRHYFTDAPRDVANPWVMCPTSWL